MPTIVKCCVRLVMHDVCVVDAMARHGVAGLSLDSKIVHRVFKNKAKQELHRAIVGALFVLGVFSPRRLEPGLKQLNAWRATGLSVSWRLRPRQAHCRRCMPGESPELFPASQKSGSGSLPNPFLHSVGYRRAGRAEYQVMMSASFLSV